MRDLNTVEGRAVQFELELIGDTGHPLIGVFIVPSPLDNRPLRCIVSAVNGWDHVSVSRKDRCPNWHEMSFVKEKFFEEEEGAMQVHPPRSEWINNHRFCLHLFRPQNETIPVPPSWMVGDKKYNLPDK